MWIRRTGVFWLGVSSSSGKATKAWEQWHRSLATIPPSGPMIDPSHELLLPKSMRLMVTMTADLEDLRFEKLGPAVATRGVSLVQIGGVWRV